MRSGAALLQQHRNHQYGRRALRAMTDRPQQAGHHHRLTAACSSTSSSSSGYASSGGQAGGAAASATAGTSAAAAAAADGRRPRVCILGGGFGGVYTAIKLELLMWPQGKKPQITLVDAGERFVFKPLLYELLNGTASPWEVAPTFAQLLAPYPIQFVQDKVLSVEPELPLQGGGSMGGGVVRLASSDTPLPYDWLVVALGAEPSARGVPGIREHARPFVTLEDAEFVAARLSALQAAAAVSGGAAQPVVAVVGGGYAGVELAAVVAERLRGVGSVLLLTPGPCILEAAPAGQRQAAEQALRDLGVTIMTHSKATGVQRVDATATATAAAAVQPVMAAAGGVPDRPPSPEAAAVEPVAVLAAAAAAAAPAGQPPIAGTTSSGSSSTGNDPDAGASFIISVEPTAGSSSSTSSELRADLVLWTAGSQPASQPLRSALLDGGSGGGALETDATLRVLRHTRVFALGDVSSGRPSPTSSGGSSPGGFFPATAQVAFQQADYAAWNIWAGLNGRPLLPFRYQHLGDMMSLGASNAAVALPLQVPAEVGASINASPLGSLLAVAGIKVGTGLTLEGPLAQLLRRAAYLYRQPTNEQRLNVAASWLEQAVTAAARLAAEVSAAASAPPPAAKR